MDKLSPILKDNLYVGKAYDVLNINKIINRKRKREEKDKNLNREVYKICVSDRKSESKYSDISYPISESDLPQSFIKVANIIVDLIHQKITKKNKIVIIYCHQWRNRSATCCLYYLIKYPSPLLSSIDINSALSFIKNRHPSTSIRSEIIMAIPLLLDYIS